MRKHLPVYICIDTSGSMHDERIAAINAGLQVLFDWLPSSCHYSLITFDSNVCEILPLTSGREIHERTFPKITRAKSGATFLGAALAHVAQAVRRDLIPWNTHTKNTWGWYPDYAPCHHGAEIHGDGRPNLIIITDGKPSDPLAYSEAIPHIKGLNFDNIIVCGIGKKIDFASLRQLTETIVLTDEINADSCAKFFIWVAQTIMRYIRWADDLPAVEKLPVLPPPEAPAGFHLLQQMHFMRRLPIYLCIDTSGSMRGVPIKMVNDALRMVRSAALHDPYMLEMAYISIITFDMQVREVLPLTPIEILYKYELPEIACPGSGASLFGAALERIAQIVARNAIRSSPEQKGDWSPFLFIFTNGKLNDPLTYDAAIPLIKNINFQRVVVFTTSSKADIANLKRLTKIICSLETEDTSTIRAFFPQWVS